MTRTEKRALWLDVKDNLVGLGFLLLTFGGTYGAIYLGMGLMLRT